MRSRSLISADCSLTLHFCHRAGSRASVNQCHNMIGPKTRGGNSVSVWSLCASCSYRDSASSFYLQVHAASLNDPLFTRLRSYCTGSVWGKPAAPQRRRCRIRESHTSFLYNKQTRLRCRRAKVTDELLLNVWSEYCNVVNVLLMYSGCSLCLCVSSCHISLCQYCFPVTSLSMLVLIAGFICVW